MAKSKYSMHYCAYCHKETKMMIIGGMNADGQSVDATGKMWYRCTRCKHSALLDQNISAKTAAQEKLNRDSATEYSASKVFTVGQTIYHSEWDDLGRVVAKIKTSSGVQAITVSFENHGERKLIENIAAETLQDHPSQL